MDLIYTNAKKVDQGVLAAYTFDLAFGASENDFEMTVGSDEAVLEFGAFVYIEGTEYGGTVDAMKATTDGETITYTGRTWHGILNSKVLEPNSGEDYLVVSGDAHDVLTTLISRMGLGGLFTVAEEMSGISISNHKFTRYCKAYDGIRAMLEANGAKLVIAWEDRAVKLSVVPMVDYTDYPIDGDLATLRVEQHKNKVNHMICLGKGELADREIIHLYVDQFGRIGTVQYYTGLDEITDTYDNSNAESSDELKDGGTKRLKELMDSDKAEIAIIETEDFRYDIGDIVGASEIRSGVTVSAAVTRKIVKINNGVVSTEYKTGG